MAFHLYGVPAVWAIALLAVSRLPDPSTGMLNGKVALMGAPVDTQSKPLPLEHCRVHVVESADETREGVYPCGQWFQPPAGRYLFWLENGTGVSSQSVLQYAAEPFRTSGYVLTKTLRPAGSVQLDARSEVPRDATFRLLSLEVVPGRRPFDRRIGAVDARKPVVVPTGRFIAGVFDADGRPLSLSMPQVVSAGATTVTAPAPPQRDASALVVVLDRFDVAQPLRRCEATLMTRGVAAPAPAVNLQAHDRVVLVWYRLMPSNVAGLQLRCEGRRAFEKDVRLTAGSIATIRETLPAKE